MHAKTITVKTLMLLVATACVCVLAGCGGGPASGDTGSQSASATQLAERQAAIPIKVLILPHFEVDGMSGDFPGEAQYYYEEYLQGGDEYDVRGLPEGTKLYQKDGIALCLTGQGKVSTALAISAVLSDERFDFSDTYVIATGCAGAARDYGVLGDVYVISAAADYDLGHQADTREQGNGLSTTWYHDEDYDDIAVVMLDQKLVDDVFNLVKDTHLETTEQAVTQLAESFPGEEWATRPPQVLKGTSITGDNYWKGAYGHQNALLVTETYGCPDPFAATEMEDIAVCRTLESFGMLDRLIILRAAVNMDVFTSGNTPESLWGSTSEDQIASSSSMESADIFAPAMRNNYAVGKVVIQAILDGELNS